MTDEEFAIEFPDAYDQCRWELDLKWFLLTSSISAWISKQTGLPIDFQFQPQTWANQRHNKPRSAMGMKLVPRSQSKEANAPALTEDRMAEIARVASRPRRFK